MNRNAQKYYNFIGPIVLLSIWFFLTTAGIVHPLFLPKPQDVFSSLIHDFATLGIFTDIGSTLYRAFTALILGSLVGIPLGLLMGYFDRLYYAGEFLLEFFRSTPATSLFPLFLLLFGVGDTAKIILAFWVVLFGIIVHTLYGVRLGRRARYRTAQVMKFSGFLLFKKFIFPEALPQIFAGLRIALSSAFVVTVVMEMFIGTQYGIGKRIIDAQISYRIPEMYGAILLIGMIGFISNKLFISWEKKVIHWSGK